MTTTEHITTAEQLLQASGLGPCELVRGELVMMTPAGSEHAVIALRVGWVLAEYVERKGLGVAFGSDGGFVIERNPDTVRSPDAAFVRAERIGTIPVGFFPGPPDLAVEVVSPGDRASAVQAKAEEWLRAGCRAVWVVSPEAKTVSVYRPDQAVAVLGLTDQLSGDDVLPGFRLPVSRIFNR